MSGPLIPRAVLLLAAAGIWPALPAHSVGLLLKGTGGSPVELSEIQALFMAGEDSTTVHLRGYFDGPLREFVWLVPVPAGSKVELSHKDIFQRLDQTTGPRFHLFHEDEATP